MSPIPAPITTDIVELCRKLVVQADRPTEFDLARLDSMLKKIEHIDRTAFLTFRGVSFSFLDEKEKGIEYHRLAIVEEPDNFYAYTNFSVSLQRLGEFDMAVEVDLKALERFGATKELIKDLLNNAYYARQDALIDQWLPQYHNLAHHEHPIERLMKVDSLQGEDLAISELMAVSLASGAFSDVLSQEEDRAWQHLQ